MTDAANVTAANVTIETFGWPNSVVKDYGPWVVMVRPAQTTWGALVLACKEDKTAFSDLSDESFAALPAIIRDVEAALKAAFDYDKINYLMLMMVDPNVHYHIFPRHAEPRTFNGVERADSGWPKPLNLADTYPLDEAEMARMVAHLQAHWPS